MRRVRVKYLDEGVEEYKCKTASFGHDSLNIVLYDAVDPRTGRLISERVLLPLSLVASVEESAW